MKKSIVWQIVEVVLLLLGAGAGVMAESEIRKEAKESAKMELLESGKEEGDG